MVWQRRPGRLRGMMMRLGCKVKAVVAFGGNAIARAEQRGTFDEQLANVRTMSEALVALVAQGVGVVVTHGNGPQVGKIALQQEIADSQSIPPMPFDAAGAMSEGLIGYMLQQSLHNALRAKGLDTCCVTVVTQVIVSPEDLAFRNPTKPVGGFYKEHEARGLAAGKGWTIVEDAGRGYRRVVPSPMPQSIVEWPAIAALLEAGVLVVAAGGGGVPVVEQSGVSGIPELRGVEAVIDKDRASARLAALVKADTLVLLTDVERVAIGYGTPEERWLETVSLREMKAYLESGEFPAGSMGPKVESGIRFLEDGGGRSIITSPANLVRAVMQGGGTQIRRNGQGVGSGASMQEVAGG